MTTIEQEVARHYAHGTLEAAISEGLAAMGHATDRIDPDALAAVDEFHMGGHQATLELADGLGLRAGLSVLDIGCGLGGPARLFARRHDCTVTGIDLTPDYIAAARMLTRRTGLEDRIEYQVASALDLPFAEASFDAATLIHVGMNIPDKERLCREAARVLRSGAVFGIYDVMRTGDGAIVYPVAWAADAATSFLAPPEAYRSALAAASFEVTSERSQRELALEMFGRLRQSLAEGGPPPLGLHILMGQDAPAKLVNLIAALEAERIAPIEMICRRRA